MLKIQKQEILIKGNKCEIKTESTKSKSRQLNDQPLYYPTNPLTCIKCMVLKTH